MKIIVREESIIIEGYVNAVERNSKPLNERGVKFIERMAAGVFKRAIERASDIHVLLNHKWSRDLGSIKAGNLELTEDNIGLFARATITDKEVIEDAKRGNLTGWSFGFEDLPDGVTQLRDEESGYPLRKVSDINLFEVSILNRQKSPAYAGTLINVRDDGTEEKILLSETYEDDVETIDETTKEALSEIREESPETPKEDEAADKAEPHKTEVSSEYFARYRNIITELKGLVKNQ